MELFGLATGQHRLEISHLLVVGAAGPCLYDLLDLV